MKEAFEKIHHAIESLNDPLYKGIQLYFSALHQSDILFIGINPGAGFSNYEKKRVKRFSPLQKFEYLGHKYFLAAQTKSVFKEAGLERLFLKSVKINHYPFATKNVNDLNRILAKYGKEHKLYSLSKQFVIETIEVVKPKLIICEGKSSFDKLKSIISSEILEYNENIYILQTNNYLVIGYKRHFSRIKDKKELISKLNKYSNL